MRNYSVCILSNYSGTLYTGMTNDLERRLAEHRAKLKAGFTKKYNVTSLVYYEHTNRVTEAIQREKEIKAWRRSKKLDLIRSMNPEWNDLSAEWSLQEPHMSFGAKRGISQSSPDNSTTTANAHVIPSATPVIPSEARNLTELSRQQHDYCERPCHSERHTRHSERSEESHRSL